MGKQIAKSKGNFARRAMQRNQGLPGGIKRTGKFNVLPNMDEFLNGATTLHELERKIKLLRRWKVSFGSIPEFSNSVSSSKK
jgi:hypothetical protein